MRVFQKKNIPFGAPAARCLVGVLILAWPLIAFAQKEKGCLDCHPGYFDDLKGEFNHFPFEGQDCYACHKFHGFRNATELLGPIREICGYCHGDIAGIDDEFLHPPIADGGASCLNCHDPHSSSSGDLLSRPIKAVCLECHEAPGEFSGFVHAPYRDTSCAVCHNPHGSPFGSSFPVPIEYVCLECHADDFEDLEPSLLHAAGTNRNCENCHQAHQSPYSRLLTVEPDRLCRQCHTELFAEIERRGRHSVLEDNDCQVCHTPHFEKGGDHLIESQQALCFTCHRDIEERVHAAGAHAAAEDDCRGCHDPHVQADTTAQPTICGECHDIEDSGFNNSHLNITPKMCSECHDPHGSPSEKLLRVNRHVPFAENECGICHTPGQNREQLRRNEPCLDCHKNEPDDTVHGEVGTAGGTCVQCHSPHASSREKLLRTE